MQLSFVVSIVLMPSMDSDLDDTPNVTITPTSKLILKQQSNSKGTPDMLTVMQEKAVQQALLKAGGSSNALQPQESRDILGDIKEEGGVLKVQGQLLEEDSIESASETASEFGSH